MELIDYVTNTPQNTNRTILKQLVNSEKNKAVYESVEELKRDGGVGYTEVNHERITFNGQNYIDSFPGELIGLSGEICRISEKILLEDSVEQVKMFRKYSNGEVVRTAIKRDRLIYERTEEFLTCSAKQNAFDLEVLLFICFLHDIPVDDTTTLYAGTYVLNGQTDELVEYVEEIEAETETVHPIDKKYLPEMSGGIPEVDFGELTASEDGSGYYTSVDANLFQDYPYFLGKMSMQDNEMTLAVYLLFTKFGDIFWTGYTRTTSNFDSVEIVGSIMVQSSVSILTLTVTLPTTK